MATPLPTPVDPSFSRSVKILMISATVSDGTTLAATWASSSSTPFLSEALRFPQTPC